MTTLINPVQAYLDQTEITKHWIERLLNRRLTMQEANETFRYLAGMYQVGYTDGRIGMDPKEKSQKVLAFIEEEIRKEKEFKAS